MSTPDISIRLDTAAFGRARTARISRRAAYWLILVAGVVALAAAAWLVAVALTDHGPARAAAAAAKHPAKAAAPLPPAPTLHRPALGAAPLPGATTVLVWNGYGGKGAAGDAAARLGRLGYRVGAVGNAPDLRYRHTLLLYARGHAAAAVKLARRLGLPPAAVGPLDVPAARIRPAKLLLILGSE